MDDIMDKIQDILGSEEGMQQLRSMAQSLGIDIDEQLDEVSKDDGVKDDGKASEKEEQKPQMDFSGIDIDMLMKLNMLLGSFNKEDDNTKLLLALKPHFGDERKEKVDKAIRMMQLMSLLPILQESGLLGGLFKDGKQDI